MVTTATGHARTNPRGIFNHTGSVPIINHVRAEKNRKISNRRFPSTLRIAKSWHIMVLVHSMLCVGFQIGSRKPGRSLQSARSHGKILLTETFETVWVVDGGLPLPRQRNEIRRFDDRIKIVQTKSGINVMAEWRPFI